MDDHHISQETRLTASGGIVTWLQAHRTSLAFTSFHTGQLFVCGLHPDGGLAVNQQPFGRATGLDWRDGGLIIGTDRGLYRFENVVDPKIAAEDAPDCMLVPRAMWLTGDLAIGEVATGPSGQPLFVNQRHGCLAEPDRQHAFRSVGKQPTADMAWTLTGLAMDCEHPAYVTVIAPPEAGGGMVVGLADGEPVVVGLSMPHSPRVEGSTLFVLESGRGRLLAYDRASGTGRVAAQFAGFARGLALHDGFAMITLSNTHDSNELATELSRRGDTPWCGVAIIDLASGTLAEWIRLDGQITELFDVAALQGVRYPVAVGPFTDEQRGVITNANDEPPRADQALP